jgi:outer membrane immunogenic protein
VRKELTVAPAMALLIASSGSALSADLPSVKAAYAPPPPPPIWSGFYAGLNAGYGFGSNGNVYTDPAISSFSASENGPLFFPGDITNIMTLSSLAANAGSASVNQNGFIGGGQVGYNYQWGPSFLIGIEADIQGAGIRGSGQTIGGGVASYSSGGGLTETATSVGSNKISAGVDWLGTVRGRLGYLVTPTLLIFGTGGLSYGGAYANITNYSATTYSVALGEFNQFFSPAPDTTHTFIGGGQKSQTLVGWNAGGGLEWMFMPNWSLKAEAFYWNLGNMNVGTASFAAAPLPGGFAGPGPYPAATFGVARINYAGVVARAGVNYHFNWGSLLR